METQKPKTSFSRIKKGVFIGCGAILLIMVIGIVSGQTNPPDPNIAQQKATDDAKKQADKEKTGIELAALMDRSKEAGLIHSYDFSSGKVVYANNAWYAQDVTFKKQWLVQVSSLKEASMGVGTLDVRDRQSNEKLGEVTAFGSVEVYR